MNLNISVFDKIKYLNSSLYYKTLKLPKFHLNVKYLNIFFKNAKLMKGYKFKE